MRYDNQEIGKILVGVDKELVAFVKIVSLTKTISQRHNNYSHKTDSLATTEKSFRNETDHSHDMIETECRAKKQHDMGGTSEMTVNPRSFWETDVGSCGRDRAKEHCSLRKAPHTKKTPSKLTVLLCHHLPKEIQHLNPSKLR